MLEESLYTEETKNLLNLMLAKKKNRKKPLKIYGTLDDVLKAAVKGNPKPNKPKKRKK